MKQVPTNITKERSKVLMDVVEKISRERNALWKGWIGKALVDEYGKSNTMVARNYTYKPIIIQGRYSLGDEVEVTIEETATYDLRAFGAENKEMSYKENVSLIKIRV